MITIWRICLLIAAAAQLAGCTGGGGPSCGFGGATQLAPNDVPTSGATPIATPAFISTWPKFRADVANTGRASVDLTSSRGQGATLLFDGYCSAAGTVTTTVCTFGDDSRCESVSGVCTRIGTTPTTPLVAINSTTGQESIFLASSDGNVYVTDPPIPPSPPPSPTPSNVAIQLQGQLVGSPLLGADGTLFVPSNAQLTQFFPTGYFRTAASLIGFPAASPNIWQDGTVYVPTQTGSLAAVCPNGVPRFVIPVPPTSSTAVVVRDPNRPTEVVPIIVVGGVDGQVRAYNLTGNQYWSLFASANITAALMVDLSEDPDILYVVDSGGHLLKTQLMNGLAVGGFAPQQFGKVSASPALGRDLDIAVPKLYIASEDGILYAVNRQTGQTCWKFFAEGRITSSPAVATGGDHDVIVLAVDVVEEVVPGQAPVPVGGRVYAVPDFDADDNRCDANAVREAMWTVTPGFTEGYELGYTLGASSPAIDGNGTIYIGRTGTRLGIRDEADVVNDAGALYAIDPG